MAPRRPKDIGTAAESAVVKYLRLNGFPHAERRSLRGTNDAGDIVGCLGLVFEIKGGDAARNASDKLIESWLAETELERFNATADYGLLVVARSRKNVSDWWACMWAEHLVHLRAGIGTFLVYRNPCDEMPVRTTLHHIVDLLRANGYGQPHEHEEITA